MLIIIGAIMLQYVTILQWGKCLGAKCPWGILSWGILSVGQNVLGAKCLLAVKYVVIMFLNQQTLKEKNLDEDTLLLFRTTFNAKGHFNLVCCAEQSLESEAPINDI